MGHIQGRGRHRSLGMRLVLLFLLLALAVTLVFVGGMRGAVYGGWTEFGRPLLADYIDRLAAEIGTPPDAARARALAQRLPVAIRIDGPQVRLDTRSRTGSWHQDDGPALLTRTTADGHRIHFGIDPAAWPQRPRLVGWATLAALLLLTAIAYAAVRHLFRPLDDIRAGARRFGEGDFSQPIPVGRPDELGRLAGQINAMATALESRLEAKRALLLAISHELRSPLTRARLNAELVPEGEARDALLRDLAEMRDLIGDLLESERLAGGHRALHLEAVQLNQLVGEVVQRQFAGADVELDLQDGLPAVQADRVRLTLLLRNLIENALGHGASARPPLVRTTVHTGAHPGRRMCLVVRDFGPGVPAEQLGHLGEAFHRADPSRARSAGGVGLGLALCQLVARAHGGQLGFRNAEPGLEATLSLPWPG